MADLRLTDGNDSYTQPEADKNLHNTVYGEGGNDTIRMYQGTAFGSRGDDRIERVIDPSNPNRGLTAAYWDASTGILVNLAEGWAEDGHGGRDTLIGVTDVLGNGTDDRVIGDANNNSFGGNGGDDHFDGGGGVDTASLWFSVAGRGFGVARLADVVVRVSADGRNATITPTVAADFSLTLVDVERIGVTGADGQQMPVDLVDLITPRVLAEDTIAAGGTLRWNATQALGTATTLTYSFVEQSSEPGFRAFTASEQQVVRDILATTAGFAGLTFTELAESAGGVGQLRFGVSQQATSKGRAALPGTLGDAAGDVWMDVESMVNVAVGSEGHAALLHEIGHALGLRHPRNTDPGESWPMELREVDDRPGLTAMSSQVSADGLFRADWGLLDVIALRYLYGERQVSVGDDRYVLDAAAGSAAHTLVDDGGHDSLDASQIASGVSIDLVPGRLGSAGITSAGFLGVENYGIGWNTWIEAVVGSLHDDVLVGNELDNALTGGHGNDWIDGGPGDDTAVFAGARADYLLSNAFGKLYIEARDGVSGFDTLSSIEALRFADQSVKLTTAAVGADAEFGVDEDMSLVASLPDPSDVTRAQATYRLVGAPHHGISTIDSDGRLSYTPDANFSGADEVAYELSSSGSNNRYMAYVTVRRVNDGPPVSRDVTLLVPGGITTHGALPAADDPDEDLVTYAATAAAKQGEAVLSADGSFLYTPKAGFQGNDQFGFIVGDGVGGTNTYTASLVVMPVTAIQLGTAADDTLTGTTAANGLLGLEGNDRIRGGGNNDLIDGGAGIDTGIYLSRRSEYLLAKTAFGWTVQDRSGSEGNDSLAEVERLKFGVDHVALDLDANAGTVAQVVRALFGSAALTNKAYIGVGLQLVDAGMGLEELVQLAVSTSIFEGLAGSRSNAAFVNLVYSNVVGQMPSAAELAQFVGLLDSGAFTQTSLGVLASHHALNAASADLVGLVTTGLDFEPQGG